MKRVVSERYIFFVPSAHNHCGSNEEGVVEWSDGVGSNFQCRGVYLF